MLKIDSRHSAYKLLSTVQENLKRFKKTVVMKYAHYPLTIQLDQKDEFTITLYHPHKENNPCLIKSDKKGYFEVSMLASNELAFYLSSDLQNVLKFVNQHLTKQTKTITTQETEISL